MNTFMPYGIGGSDAGRQSLTPQEIRDGLGGARLLAYIQTPSRHVAGGGASAPKPEIA